jgi:hypothetical protein
MANEKIIAGDAGILYVWDGAAWLPVGCLTSYSLNTNAAEKTRQTKCNPGVTEKGYGALDYTVDFEGLYLNTVGTNPDNSLASHDYLLEKQLAKEIIQWRIDTDAAPAGLGEGKQWYGSAVISALTLTQGTGDEDSQFTGTFSGTGDITDTDPNVTT